jgi:hypothetical protein
MYFTPVVRYHSRFCDLPFVRLDVTLINALLILLRPLIQLNINSSTFPAVSS